MVELALPSGFLCNTELQGYVASKHFHKVWNYKWLELQMATNILDGILVSQSKNLNVHSHNSLETVPPEKAQ